MSEMDQRVQAFVERLPSGAYVVVEAVAVHTHGCPNWRMGKRYGPCRCGASDLWAKYRDAITPLVKVIPTSLSEQPA